MTHLANCLMALPIFLLSSAASAGSVTLKQDQPLCESAPSLETAAIVQAHRKGKLVELTVVSEMNCAHIPDKPELRVWRNAASVILPTRSPSGLATACLCQHKLTFELSDMYEGARTIYYIQDDIVLGHVDAS